MTARAAEYPMADGSRRTHSRRGYGRLEENLEPGVVEIPGRDKVPGGQRASESLVGEWREKELRRHAADGSIQD